MGTKSLDELGLAITNAGYTWTTEMRKVYEKGIKESEWQGLTDEEIIVATVPIDNRKSGWVLDLSRAIEAKLREKNNG